MIIRSYHDRMTDYYCQAHGTFDDGSTWSTGLHVDSSRIPSDMLTTWSTAIQAAWTDGTHGLRVILPIGTVLNSVSVATLGPTMREIAKLEDTGLAIAGTAVGDTLPYLNSAVVSLRSANIQRKGRGRMYMPALEETFVNDDAIISTAVTRMKAAWTAVFTAIRADGSTIFVFNKKDTSPLHPPVIPAFTKETITTLLISNKPARQSRRTRKKAAVYT